MSRGDRRGAIILDGVDQQNFLKTLAETGQITGWQVQADRSLNNHSHLVMEPRTPIWWRRVARSVGEPGVAEDPPAGQEPWQRRLEAQRLPETNAEGMAVLRRVWCCGGEHHAGDLRQESAAARAERIIAEELTRLGWGQETTLTIEAIEACLPLSNSKHANAWLHGRMRSPAGAQTETETERFDPKNDSGYGSTPMPSVKK